jgi:hypothetical protein
VTAIEEHVQALTSFERDYRRYIEAQVAEHRGDTPNLSPGERTALRHGLLRRADGAERAMQEVGKVVHVAPPPAFGGPILTSLSQTIFAHETPLYGSGSDPFEVPNGILDTMNAALGALDDRLNAELKRPHGTRAPAPRTARSASTGRSSWSHNPWVIAIVGGGVATVVGGIILALIFG